MKYITRCDSGYTHCYSVKVGHVIKEGTFKSFSDGVYGGKAKALKAAKRWRNKEVKRLSPILNKFYDVNNQRHWGKGYHEAWKRIGEYEYLYIVATYWRSRQKKVSSKTFSVNKYGYDGAVKLAKQWRKFKITGEL